MRTFFEHQADAQRRTRWLLAAMMAAVLGMGALLFVLLSWLHGWTRSYVRLTAMPDSQFETTLFWSCVLGTAVLVLIASTWRTRSLRDGGSSVAEMLGGRLVSGQPRDARERRLLNVVEELAIAAGAPVPAVFVLDAEAGINALAAGWELHDAAIAVTRGCLDKLTRAELQGVIGHEFSHILRGDMRLNLRLTGTLFGILFLALLGRQVLRAANLSRRHGMPVAIVGVGLIGIGGLGSLCANVIKAAVSRQREFLADASAVQFTRDSSNICAALKKIGGHDAGAAIVNSNAEEASHFFFADSASARRLAPALFATHPALIERIQRLEPDFRGPFARAAADFAEPDEVSTSGAGDQETSASRSVPPPAALVTRLVGANNVNAMRASQSWLERTPATLREAAQNPYSACALVYACVLSEDPAVQERQQQLIANASASGPPLQHEVRRLEPLVHKLPRADRLLLAELACSALQQLVKPQCVLVTRTLDALIEADASISLFEYLLADLLRVQVTPQRQQRRRRLASMPREVELVVSLLAHAGDLDGQSAATAFGQAAVRLRGVAITLLPRSARQLSGLSHALGELRQVRPKDGAQLVDACSHAVLADQRATDVELTLLRATCLALGAPIPLLG